MAKKKSVKKAGSANHKMALIPIKKSRLVRRPETGQMGLRLAAGTLSN